MQLVELVNILNKDAADGANRRFSVESQFSP